MAANTSASNDAPDELVIEYTFDAPRELVWKAWTEPERLMHWWGPQDLTPGDARLNIARLDFRPGGVFHYSLQSPDGSLVWGKFVYREIAAPKRIVFVSSFTDEAGNPTRHPQNPAWPLEVINTLTLSVQEGQTTLILRQSLHAGEADRKAFTDAHEATRQDFRSAFDRLAAFLAQGSSLSEENQPAKTQFTAEPGKQTIVITRLFDAPRRNVFQAYTDPNLLPYWWGPEGLATTVDRMEVRPGGGWRFVQRAADGSEHAFHGVYHDVVAPQRLVYTFEFEGAPDHVLLETVTFEEQDGQTRETDQLVFQSVEDRDAMLQSGMQAGATETMERFAELLKRLSSEGRGDER